MVDKQTKPSEYILRTGSQGANNLDLQHEIFKDESFAQLKEAGLTKKMIVWDIGCGSGVMTEYLAKAVGDKGQVYALDVSEDQIKVAKKRIEAAGYKNVKFIVGDINKLDSSAYKKADIIYVRFLLMHVSDPVKIIKLMASFLKPGGVLSLQESSMDSVKKENNSNADINKFYDLIIAYGKLKGFDYNVGRKLPVICDKLNIFSKVIFYSRNYATDDEIKNLLALRLDELQDKFVSANLISEAEYITLKGNIHKFLRDRKCDQCIMMSEQSHVLAFK